MKKIFTLILFALFHVLAISQPLNFPETVNKLFFNVDVSNTSATILDSFASVKVLHKEHFVRKQRNLNVRIQMNSDKALTATYKFKFYESPLPKLNFDYGEIEVMLGETDSSKILLHLDWTIYFVNKPKAKTAFELLKKMFDSVSTLKNFSFNKEAGHIAAYSTRKETDKGIRNINLFYYWDRTIKKYAVGILFGNVFYDKHN